MRGQPTTILSRQCISPSLVFLSFTRTVYFLFIIFLLELTFGCLILFVVLGFFACVCGFVLFCFHFDSLVIVWISYLICFSLTDFSCLSLFSPMFLLFSIVFLPLFSFLPISFFFLSPVSSLLLYFPVLLTLFKFKCKEKEQIT